VAVIRHARAKTEASVRSRAWSPEQARSFSALMEGDRSIPVWAFLSAQDFRIGELVALRWNNVDLTEGVVSVVEFSTYSARRRRSSARVATRSGRVDIDRALVGVFASTARAAARSGWQQTSYEETGHVFTRPGRWSLPSQYLSRLLGRYSQESAYPV